MCFAWCYFTPTYRVPSSSQEGRQGSRPGRSASLNRSQWTFKPDDVGGPEGCAVRVVDFLWVLGMNPIRHQSVIFSDDGWWIQMGWFKTTN